VVAFQDRVRTESSGEICLGKIAKLRVDEKHWHGATPTTAMTRIAIQETLDGKVAYWMEKITDEEYRK